MAAISVNLLRNGRTGSFASQTVTYEAVYQVITDNSSDGPNVVAFASGIPRLGDLYAIGNDVDSRASAVGITPEQDTETPRKWQVRVAYSSEAGGTLEIGEEFDPIDRPPRVEWDKEEYVEVIEKELSSTSAALGTSRLIQTACGESYDPFPEVVRYRPIVRIRRNFILFNDALKFDYLGAVNLTRWFGGDSRTWMCRDLATIEKHAGGLRYVEVTGEFVYNRDTWDLKILHQGFLVRTTTSATEKPTRAHDNFGEPVTRPVLLDAEGRRLAQGSTSHVIHTYYVYPEKDFHTLSLV